MLFKVLIIITHIFTSTLAFGQILNPYGSKENASGGREYFVGTNLGKPLLTVNLVSGVNQPGVYHIPIDTNLAELFSYAGGLLATSDLQKVTLRSFGKSGAIKTRTIDFESALTKDKSLVSLADRDIIHIDQKESLDRTLKWLSIASILVSMTATIVVLERNR